MTRSARGRFCRSAASGPHRSGRRRRPTPSTVASRPARRAVRPPLGRCRRRVVAARRAAAAAQAATTAPASRAAARPRGQQRTEGRTGRLGHRSAEPVAADPRAGDRAEHRPRRPGRDRQRDRAARHVATPATATTPRRGRPRHARSPPDRRRATGLSARRRPSAPVALIQRRAGTASSTGRPVTPRPRRRRPGAARRRPAPGGRRTPLRRHRSHRTVRVAAGADRAITAAALPWHSGVLARPAPSRRPARRRPARGRRRPRPARCGW